MKTILSILIIGFIFFGITSSKTTTYPKIAKKSYTSGEWLKYKLSYGFVDAGEAILTVEETKLKGANNRPLYHVKGVGKTLKPFSWFYKVHDVYESYIDKEGGFPWYFVRNVNEGGYTINQRYIFKQNREKVIAQNEKENYKAPMGIQDMISSFYHARTLDYSSMRPGDVVGFKCFMDGEIWPLKIKYMGKETIDISAGKFKCLKFKPAVQEGRVFRGKDKLTVWVTDDKNHIPILAKAKIAVGSLKMHLVDWRGLLGDLAKVD